MRNKPWFQKMLRIIEKIFGIGIALCLFAGGLTFFGFLAALCIGGDTGTAICTFIHKTLFNNIIIYAGSICVLLGLIRIYLGGDHALRLEKKRK